MEKSGFFNSVNKDRQYFYEDIASMLNNYFTNGIFNNSLQVIAKQNMTIQINSGSANVNGYFYMNTDVLNKELKVADGTQSRIDTVVLRLNIAKRSINVEIIEGDYATNPSSPNLIRDNNIYDLRLANVKITAGLIEITDALIEDTRFGEECGNVVGAIESISSDNIFKQYEEIFNNFFSKSTAEFSKWFAELKVELDGNVATNLQQQITDLEESVIYFEEIDEANI